MSKGGKDSNLGSVGRAAEAVCRVAMGEQPSRQLQDAANAWCARVGQKADEAVNYQDNNYSVSTMGSVGHWDNGYTTYNPDSTVNQHQDRD